jgi:hypothetical protein
MPPGGSVDPDRPDLPPHHVIDPEG